MVCVHVAALVSFLIKNIILDHLPKIALNSYFRGVVGQVKFVVVNLSLFTDIEVRRCFANKLLGK